MREKKLSRRRWLKEATVLGLAVDGSTHARALRANERQNSPAAGRGDDRELKLKLETRDYFNHALVFRWPEGIGSANSANVEARVSITQPYGFRQEVTGTARRVGDRGEVVIRYPLIDEGRYAAKPLADAEGSSEWEMGGYRFSVALGSGPKDLAAGVLELDPNSFFGEIGGQKLAQVDSLRQFIECCPERPAFIDKREVAFTARMLTSRVQSCSVEADVVEPRGVERVAGPLHLKLDGRIQRNSFDGEGWAGREYWLRLRILEEGKPVGPYLVRQIYLETPYKPSRPENPLRIGQVPQYLVDGWIFASSSGLEHVPDQLEHLSNGPIVELDRPWEKGPDHLTIESVSYDEKTGLYHATYNCGPLTDDDRLWKMGVRSTITAYSIRYLCLAVSRDGVTWEKPDLGMVDYQGSRRNNILRDRLRESFLLSGEFDSFPAPVKERPLPRRYRYRFYDPKRDGPVEMDNFVFRVFLQQSMEPDDQFQDGFRPKHGEFWGFERRGDMFLALTRQPVLTRARGMHLIHTNERASTYPFEGEPFALFQPNGRSTCTYYHRKSKTFFYYFRPDYPAYPPNGLPFYLWHRVAAIRTRAVMWTRDGLNWERRHMTVPDEHDPRGTTLYGFGFIKPEGSEVSDTDDQLYLGALLNWDLSTQTNRQHLMWSRDLIHWNKFGANRKPLLDNGPLGQWNASTSGLCNYYPVRRAGGEEDWLFTFNGNNSRYMLGGYLTADTLEAFKSKFPYFELAPFFTSWKDFYEETKRFRVLPGLARCKAGRLVHVEPRESKGEFTTLPVVAEGNRLLLNARTDPGGSIRVEVQDAEGNPFPGLMLADSVPFSGDRVAYEAVWKRAKLVEVNRRVIRLRVVLDRARLFTFGIAS